jgi:hypothetical protein
MQHLRGASHKNAPFSMDVSSSASTASKLSRLCIEKTTPAAAGSAKTKKSHDAGG